MPDLHSRLSAAAAAAEPSARPLFATLRTRARRRVQRRLLGASVVVAIVAATGVAVASGGGTQRQVPVAAPCVERTSENASDVFAEIPTSGEKKVDLFVHQWLTVGWKTCGETGTFTTPNEAKGLLSPSGASAGALASNRYYAISNGDTTITGNGSEGSHGVLIVHMTYRPEPDGMSGPSPYPQTSPEHAGPPICKAGDVTDDRGYLTKAVTYSSGQSLLDPPGAVRSRHTKAEVLDRASQGDFRITGSGVDAAFGLLTAQNFGGGTRLPRWIVYRCAMDSTGEGFGGHGGPFRGQTPAPGTSPVPFGHIIGLSLSLYDENLHPVYSMGEGLFDDETLAQQFVEVPFERTHEDSADGRQIGITYPTYDCATFSHLDTYDRTADRPVYVLVWLRVTNETPCEQTGSTTAVVGLTYPLGSRDLVRGEARASGKD